jgi:hypothetical protein
MLSFFHLVNSHAVFSILENRNIQVDVIFLLTICSGVCVKNLLSKSVLFHIVRGHCLYGSGHGQVACESHDLT